MAHRSTAPAGRVLDGPPCQAGAENARRVYFVSAHLDLSQAEFDTHYVPALDAAVKAGARFVVGDARGADAMAQAYLFAQGAKVRVFHMFESPRHRVGELPAQGGFESDSQRDRALTAASDGDIAWVRPGRERSGTARNLARRTDGLPVLAGLHVGDGVADALARAVFAQELEGLE